MTITDLFSHKIHSSGDDWPEKLAEIAAIFAEFDGQLYDRNAFEERFKRISPRASYVGRDISKFRDEISAYPAYLGLYFLEQSSNGWIVRISETAKRFLIREEPDVASFLRLQLPLFQYPNAMGAVYSSSRNTLDLQHNARERTLDFINQGIHLSPMRLIALALKSDAELRDIDILESCVTSAEIYALANTSQINQHAMPPIEDVKNALYNIREGNIIPPAKFENRFHILKHTEMFMPERSTIKVRATVNDADRDQLLRQLNAICSISNQFNNFDGKTTKEEIKDVIASGTWGRYFDGVRMLPSNIVEVLTNDQALELFKPLDPAIIGGVPVIPSPVAEIYDFRERTNSLPKVNPYNRRREMADPQLTRIKMQRRNLAHKELVSKMDDWLRGRVLILKPLLHKISYQKCVAYFLGVACIPEANPRTRVA